MSRTKPSPVKRSSVSRGDSPARKRESPPPRGGWREAPGGVFRASAEPPEGVFRASPKTEDAETASLLAWFASHRRDLPWRSPHPDPYVVWVSEIMLQQTRIDTAIGYFRRFLDAFPDIPALAAADIQDVLRVWQGLGYYSRARNLHRAAQLVQRDFGGRLPDTAADLRKLPGIGDYTAAAIASICHGECVATVDGNVLRVVARRTRSTVPASAPAARPSALKWLAPRIAAATSPGDFNQAMMELGETVCTPVAPDCGHCPWKSSCVAAASGTPERWPVKAPAKTVPTRKSTAVVLRRPDGAVLLVRRTGERFLGEMWELPTKELPGLADLKTGRSLGVVRHAYSHFRLILSVFRLSVPADFPALPDSAWVLPEDFPSYPISKAPKMALELALHQP